jgi:hypothetical protein
LVVFNGYFHRWLVLHPGRNQVGEQFRVAEMICTQLSEFSAWVFPFGTQEFISLDRPSRQTFRPTLDSCAWRHNGWRFSRAAAGGVGWSERLARHISITRRNVRIHHDYQSKTTSLCHLQEYPKRDIHA